MRKSSDANARLPDVKSSDNPEHKIQSGSHSKGLELSTLSIAIGVSGCIWTLIFVLLNFDRLALFSAAITIFALPLLRIAFAYFAERLRAGLKTNR